MAATELLKRSISGGIYVGLLVASLWFGPPFFPLFMALVAIGCWWEYLGLLPQKPTGLLRWILWSPGLLFAASFLFPHIAAKAVWVLLLLAVIGFLLGLGKTRSSDLWLESAAGLLFSTLPFWLLSRLSFAEGGAFKPLLMLFLLVWTNDTMAYLGGKLLGKRKLAPSISPGKSVEGFAIGWLFAMAVAALLGFYWLQADWYRWPLFALIYVPLAVAGDLFQSFLKRRVGKKDSGRIMPGHGGFLDRFDSFLLAVPLTWGLFWVLRLA
jgi:phosphatidate cytidylyltransferase